MSDENFMAQALALGRRGLGSTAPNPSVGAVLVRDGAIVGAGATSPGGRPHGERNAIAAAGAAAKGATLYVTLEPCSHHGKSPPCVDAILEAGVARVVSAMDDPDLRVAGQGHARLRSAGVNVEIGLGGAQARIDHRGHILRVTKARPMCTLKLARTADGYAAGDEHDPRLHITGQDADHLVNEMRAAHDAIMVGVGTVLVDDPLLAVRLPEPHNRPLRVILDSHLRLPTRSRLCATVKQFATLVITTPSADATREAELRAIGVEVARVGADARGRVDLSAAFAYLAKRGITRVFSEGGPRVGAKLIAEGLADDVALFTALRPLGRPGVAALDADALAALEDARRYGEVENIMIGPDRFRLLRSRA